MLACPEINIVRSERLWPRGLSTLAGEASTRADVRAYSLYTRRETHARNLDVTTRYTPTEAPSQPAPPAAEQPDAEENSEQGRGQPTEAADDRTSQDTAATAPGDTETEQGNQAVYQEPEPTGPLKLPEVPE